jgi:hypothetical protein
VTFKGHVEAGKLVGRATEQQELRAAAAPLLDRLQGGKAGAGTDRADTPSPAAPPKPDATSPSKKPKKLAVILSHGNQRYSVGDGRIIPVEDNEDSVLQALLEAPGNRLDKQALIDNSGCERAPTILKGLTLKHEGCFAAAIYLPGRRGQGGYHANIRHAKRRKDKS